MFFFWILCKLVSNFSYSIENYGKTLKLEFVYYLYKIIISIFVLRIKFVLHIWNMFQLLTIVINYILDAVKINDSNLTLNCLITYEVSPILILTSHKSFYPLDSTRLLHKSAKSTTARISDICRRYSS